MRNLFRLKYKTNNTLCHLKPEFSAGLVTFECQDLRLKGWGRENLAFVFQNPDPRVVGERYSGHNLQKL